MKKFLLITGICSLLVYTANCADAQMVSKSLTIGGNKDENPSVMQTLIKEQIEPETSAPQQTAPIEINNYIDANPYNYPYPANYYTRYIGPYGAYGNVGGFSFNYQGHGYSYGISSPVYFAPIYPPPPPPPMGGHHGGGPHGPGPHGRR